MSADLLPLEERMIDPRRPMLLSVEQLRVDSQTQRAVDPARVEKMSDEWDWTLAETPTVSSNGDGTYDVIEGQNRTLAARHRDAKAQLWCMVLDPQDRPVKAETALRIAKGRRPLSSVEKYYLRINSNDPVALLIADVLDANRLRISKQAAPRTSSAAAAMFGIVQGGRGLHTVEEGADMLARVLQVILRAWPQDPHTGRDDRFQSDILRAVAEVLAIGHGDADVAKKLKMQRRGPEYWLGLTGGTSRRQSIVNNLVAALPQLG